MNLMRRDANYSNIILFIVFQCTVKHCLLLIKVVFMIQQTNTVD